MQLKIVFQARGATETMFADLIGPNTFVLANIPVLAQFISLGDTFTAAPQHPDDPRPYFKSLLKRGPNWTYRLETTNDDVSEREDFMVLCTELKSASSGSSSYQNSIFAFNVPGGTSDAEFERFEAILMRGENLQLWVWSISSRPDLPLTQVEAFLEAHPDF